MHGDTFTQFALMATSLFVIIYIVRAFVISLRKSAQQRQKPEAADSP
jgi:hypothetical protein